MVGWPSATGAPGSRRAVTVGKRCQVASSPQEHGLVIDGEHRDQRVDLTAEHAYTLSPGTKAILRKLDTPVQIRFYVSQTADGMPVFLKTYAQQIDDLLGALSQYRIALELRNRNWAGGEQLKETLGFLRSHSAARADASSHCDSIVVFSSSSCSRPAVRRVLRCPCTS